MRALVWTHRRHRHPMAWAPLPFFALFPLVPIAGFAIVMAVVVAMSLVTALLALVAGGIVLATVLGVLGFVGWNVMRYALTGSFGHRRAQLHGRWHGTWSRGAFVVGGEPAAAETPVDVLRRRYAAGEIGQTAFRQGLVDLLKERYVRGDLTLAEFEARVQHVLKDPALRSPG